MLSWLSNNWSWLAIGALLIFAIAFVAYLVRYAKRMTKCNDEEEWTLFYSKSKEDEIERR